MLPNLISCRGKSGRGDSRLLPANGDVLTIVPWLVLRGTLLVQVNKLQFFKASTARTVVFMCSSEEQMIHDTTHCSVATNPRF